MAINRSALSKFFLITLAVLTVFIACTTDFTPTPVENWDKSLSITNNPAYQDKDLLAKAWGLPVAATYRAKFEYQINPAFCGPATLVNTFFSLNIHDYNQENIFDNSDISYYKALLMGLTLDELGELVDDNSDVYQATVVRDISLPEFREHLILTNDPSFRYTVNFNRGPLFGVDIGHHSPIGGYLIDEDLVFVLDVLDDYKPFLVTSERLYEALDTVDNENDRKRGLLRVSR